MIFDFPELRLVTPDELSALQIQFPQYAHEQNGSLHFLRILALLRRHREFDLEATEVETIFLLAEERDALGNIAALLHDVYKKAREELLRKLKHNADQRLQLCLWLYMKQERQQNAVVPVEILKNRLISFLARNYHQSPLHDFLESPFEKALQHKDPLSFVRQNWEESLWANERVIRTQFMNPPSTEGPCVNDLQSQILFLEKEFVELAMFGQVAESNFVGEWVQAYAKRLKLDASSFEYGKIKEAWTSPNAYTIRIFKAMVDCSKKLASIENNAAESKRTLALCEEFEVVFRKFSMGAALGFSIDENIRRTQAELFSLYRGNAARPLILDLLLETGAETQSIFDHCEELERYQPAEKPWHYLSRDPSDREFCSPQFTEWTNVFKVISYLQEYHPDHDLTKRFGRELRALWSADLFGHSSYGQIRQIFKPVCKKILLDYLKNRTALMQEKKPAVAAVLERIRICYPELDFYTNADARRALREMRVARMAEIQKAHGDEYLVRFYYGDPDTVQVDQILNSSALAYVESLIQQGRSLSFSDTKTFIPAGTARQTYPLHPFAVDMEEAPELYFKIKMVLDETGRTTLQSNEIFLHPLYWGTALRLMGFPLAWVNVQVEKMLIITYQRYRADVLSKLNCVPLFNSFPEINSGNDVALDMELALDNLERILRSLPKIQNIDENVKRLIRCVEMWRIQDTDEAKQLLYFAIANSFVQIRPYIPLASNP